MLRQDEGSKVDIHSKDNEGNEVSNELISQRVLIPSKIIIKEAKKLSKNKRNSIGSPHNGTNYIGS